MKLKTEDYLLMALIAGGVFLLTRKSGEPKREDVVGTTEWIDKVANVVINPIDEKAGTGYYLLRDEYRQ